MGDVKVVEPSRSIELYNFLKGEGFDVFWPAEHEGEVLKPYIVVSIDTMIKVGEDISSDFTIYDLLMHVPKDEYGYLEVFVMNVKTAMKKVYPTFVYYHNDMPTGYDNEIKGHTYSLQYRNAKKWNDQVEFDNM